MTGFISVVFIENLKKFMGRVLVNCKNKYGGIGGQETPGQPDEPGEVNAGDVVQGLGGGGLRRVRRV
jgi:hypothetical protein